MKMAIMYEYDNPKDEARMKKILEEPDKTTPFFQRKLEEGIVKNISSWADNTGHIVVFIEFENGENLGKFLGDEEFHRLATETAVGIDNIAYRILRPAVSAKTGKPIEL